MNKKTSFYYDSVVIQRVGVRSDHKRFKVHRHLYSPKHYRTEEEAYQAAIQLLFDVLAYDEEEECQDL